jgi:disulfide bond formation protein DsbB
MRPAIFDPLRQLSSRMLVLLAAGGSAAVLLGAIGFEHLGFAPCELCILQRWPHLAAAVLGAAILIFRLPMSLALLGALSAAATGVLAIYHSGVERGIFDGPDSCTSGGVTDMSAEDLFAQITAAPLVRCDEIVWQMFGVTMPNLNALASMVFVILWIAAFTTARRGA